MHFEWLWVLALAPLPLLVYWLLKPSVTETTTLTMPFLTNLDEFTGNVGRESSRGIERWTKISLLSCIWLCFLIAGARPQVIGDAVNVPLSGRDLMMAIDISGSMEATDIPHNGEAQTRLDAVKRIAGEFIASRPGDRIGLILFGTNAYLQAPLSLDRATVVTLLNESLIGIAGEKTSIGDAIGLAIKRLDAREQSNKVLILLTDGSNTAGVVTPQQAARLARSSGLKIHTVGIGATQMEVQDFFGRRIINPSRDLDEALLRYIAEHTGGQFFRATDEQNLAEIYRIIDQLEPIDYEANHLRPTTELYFWPLGAGISLAFVWLLVSVMRSLNGWLNERRTVNQ